MIKRNVQEMPYESLVRSIYGAQWRGLPEEDQDGALGVAIVKSVLDGLPPDLNEVSSHLGIDRELLRRPYKNLSMNGVFRNDKIHQDTQALNENDPHVWGYYAGYAAGIVGPWRPER